MNWILQGFWRKVAAVCLLLFAITMIIRDRQDNYDKLDQFQRRLLACTHHSDSLASQLEVINHYKETVEKMLSNEKNTSKKVEEAYQTKIQFLNSKNDNLQMQLNKCENRQKQPDDIGKLQTENENYRKRVEELEEKIRQLGTQPTGHENKLNDSNKANSTTTTAKSTTVIVKKLVNPENHEDVNVQPVENPNFHAVPDTEIFFNKKPREDLVFQRGGAGEPPAIADFLPHEELLKKINDRKAKKDNAEEDNVEDFRELQKPDAGEMDYKEIDH